MDVAVLGAGAAGRGIAQVCAVAGHAVSLYDQEANAVMDGIDAVRAGIEAGGADGAGADGTDGAGVEAADGAGTGAAEGDTDAALDRIEGTTGIDAAVGDADLVVDATDGDRDERRELFASVEEHVDDDATLATSAATVSITAVATGLRKPGRAVGLHFVDPPDGPLVEVVVAEQTTDETRDGAVEFVEGLDREAVVVRDAPGFAASRLSLALAVEAMLMVDEGVAGVEAVDRAMEAGHDHPVGPLVAADMAGLDARLAELEYLAGSLSDRFEPPPVLREKVRAGDLGAKSGTGFYVWEGGEPVEPADPDPRPELPEDDPAGPSDV